MGRQKGDRGIQIGGRPVSIALVLKAILNNIIWQRGVPASLKSDNAPELMQGIVRMIAEYLGIQRS